MNRPQLIASNLVGDSPRSRWVSGTFTFIPLLAISAKELREKSLLPTKTFTQQMRYRNNYSLLEPHNLKFSW